MSCLEGQQYRSISGSSKLGSECNTGCDIQKHLQSMFYLLNPEETLKMVRNILINDRIYYNPNLLKFTLFSEFK